MRPYLKEVYQKFFHIFNENSKKSRVLFFRDSLVQNLWRFYMSFCQKEFEEFIA